MLSLSCKKRGPRQEIKDMEGWGLGEWRSGPPSFLRLAYLVSTSTVHSFWLTDWAILRVSYYTHCWDRKE